MSTRKNFRQITRSALDQLQAAQKTARRLGLHAKAAELQERYVELLVWACDRNRRWHEEYMQHRWHAA